MRTAAYEEDFLLKKNVPKHILFSSTGNFISCYSRK